MIKLFFYTLLTILSGLLVTLFLAREPGYLLVSFAGATFETSLFALFVATIAMLILLRLLVLILDYLNPLRLFSAGRNWLRARAGGRVKMDPLGQQIRRDELFDVLTAQLVDGNESMLTLAELRKLWKKNSTKIITDDVLLSLYVDVLVHCDALSEAVKVLESELQVLSSDSLVRQYSLLALRLTDANALQQLHTAEAWLETRPKDAALLLALGRISLRNQLWGKAREYFDRSLREQASAETYAELARLLHSLKEQERSPKLLVEATRLVSKSLPNFPQPS